MSGCLFVSTKSFSGGHAAGDTLVSIEDVRIDFGGGDVLIIRNTTVAALDQDDFSFV